MLWDHHSCLTSWNSLAIYTRARAFLNVLDVNGQVINDTKDNLTSFPSATLGNPTAVKFMGELEFHTQRFYCKEGSIF
jgi:hypothetical protein